MATLIKQANQTYLVQLDTLEQAGLDWLIATKRVDVSAFLTQWLAGWTKEFMQQQLESLPASEKADVLQRLKVL